MLNLLFIVYARLKKRDVIMEQRLCPSVNRWLKRRFNVFYQHYMQFCVKIAGASCMGAECESMLQMLHLTLLILFLTKFNVFWTILYQHLEFCVLIGYASSTVSQKVQLIDQ